MLTACPSRSATFAPHCRRRTGSNSGFFSPDSAFAYRPFDGTDAAVANRRDGNSSYSRSAHIRKAATRPHRTRPRCLIFGLSEGWEAVFEGQGQTPLSPAGRPGLTSAAHSSACAAAGQPAGQGRAEGYDEFGVLFPDSTGENGFGASVAGSISQRWDWGAFTQRRGRRSHARHSRPLCRHHCRGAGEVEVRPERKFYEENSGGRTHLGAGRSDMAVRENLAVDVGLRHALVKRHPATNPRRGDPWISARALAAPRPLRLSEITRCWATRPSPMKGAQISCR